MENMKEWARYEYSKANAIRLLDFFLLLKQPVNPYKIPLVKGPATRLQFRQFKKKCFFAIFFLWVRVMSVKVYSFGKQITRRIYLWPRILP